jgi:Cu/Ag efflux pump CusA
VALSQGVYVEFAGAAQARAQSQHEILLNSVIAAVVIACLLYIAFGNVRNLLLVLVKVPFVLVGGVIAAWLAGG